MRVCHGFTATFDDPNLVSCAGLAPVLRLAERGGLHRLAGEHVRIGEPGGGLAQVKVPALVAGMVAGADSIEDMTLLRHGGMGRLFAGVRAPSTLGTFLRTFTFGHVRQLDAVAARLLVNLAGQAPLLPGAAELAYVDVDDTVRQTYGYAKQGAGRGYTGVKGLNALIATISTPNSAPVVAAARLRKGSTNSAKGAHRLVADALVTAKAAGASGVRVLRADSAFYSHEIIAAARRQRSRFSITARQNRSVRQAIAAIDEDAWTPIQYTNAVFDEDTQHWISAAEVAAIPYTAFTSKAKAAQVTARLIVRRVPDLNPANQSELFTAYRYHAVFTDSPLPTLEAEKAHRAHAPRHLRCTSSVTREGLAELVQALRLAPRDTMLDLACGRGGIGLEIAARTGVRLVGVDFSVEAVGQARKMAQRLGRPADFRVADLTATGLEVGSVDAVLCVDSIQFADPQDASYREIRRILAPRGRAVLTCWEPLHRDDDRLPVRLRRVDLAAGLTAAGFHDVEVSERPTWRAVERDMWEEAVALDPGEDAALQSFHDEGVRSLETFHLLRRVSATATAPSFAGSLATAYRNPGAQLFGVVPHLLGRGSDSHAADAASSTSSLRSRL
ncbi:MAG: IS1380 family transposase [Actinomycetes bacterium]